MAFTRRYGAAPAYQGLIRRFPCGRPAVFRSVRDLGRVPVGCPGTFRQSGSRSFPWLPAWLPFVLDVWHLGALVLVVKS